MGPGPNYIKVGPCPQTTLGGGVEILSLSFPWGTATAAILGSWLRWAPTVRGEVFLDRRLLGVCDLID